MKEPIVASEIANDYPNCFALMTKVLRSSSDQIGKLVNPFVSVHFQNVSVQSPVKLAPERIEHGFHPSDGTSNGHALGTFFSCLNIISALQY